MINITIDITTADGAVTIDCNANSKDTSTGERLVADVMKLHIGKAMTLIAQCNDAGGGNAKMIKDGVEVSLPPIVMPPKHD